jgi:hypothetical protein
MRKPLVYIAAPYTHPDPAENTHKAIRMADELVRHDFVPFIPHLNLLWHLVSPRPPDFWYEYDLRILERCDAILRVPGESIGADREVQVARESGIPIFYSVKEILIWMGDR